MWMHQLWNCFNLLNLTLPPCFLDVFPTSLTRCGTLDGVRNRWDCKVNFVEVMQWISSLRLSLKLRLRHNLHTSENKIPFSINNLLPRLSLTFSTFNSSFRSINPLPLHLHHNPHHKRQNHQHQWHLHPHNLDPVYPSILKRWCSKWRTRSNPACKPLWTRIMIATSATFHHLLIHHFQPLHPSPVTLIHLWIFQLHILAPIVALDPIAVIGLNLTDLISAQSPFHAALVDPDPKNELIARPDHVPPEDEVPDLGIPPDDQAGLRRSHCAQPLHNVEKDNIVDMINPCIINPVTCQPTFNLQRGNTTHNNPSTPQTLNRTTTTTINTPPTSGNLGVNGKTIPSLPTHPAHRVGLTTQDQPPTTTANTTLPLDQLQLTPPTTARHPTNHADLHQDQVHFNLEALQTFLQDVSPSTFKMAQARHGLETSSLLWIILIGCVLPTRSQLQTGPSRQQQWIKRTRTKLVNNLTKSTIGFHPMWSRRLSNSFSAQTCCQATISPLAMSANFHLIIPLPDTSHYQMPPPFGKRQNYTWALLHGTSLQTSQQILLEGKIRPANWSYNKDPQRCDLPTFGAFFLGRQVNNSDKTIPSWAEKDLLDNISKRGKGQLEIIVGAMYRGSSEHTAYKAGGNETAQLGVIEKGIVTTSEKYTIAHSNHVGLKFIALKWKNLTMKIDVGDTSSDDCNYRSNEERRSGRRRWQGHNTVQVFSCIIS